MLRFTKTVCAIAALTATSAFADITSGLTTHWTFDDCTAVDVSGNGMDGTITGTPTCVAGLTTNGTTGKALQFSSNAYITRMWSAFPTGNFTVSVWAKNAGLSNGIFNVIAGDISSSKGHDRHIFTSAGKICQRVWSDNTPDTNGDGSKNYTSCTSTKDFTEFTNIAYVVSTTSISIYINGELSKKIAGRPSEFDRADRFLLGHSFDAKIDLFSGILDDFRIYNRSLTSADIKELYNSFVDVTVSSKGLQPQSITVICENLTTQKATTVASQTNINCEAAGLVIRKDDVIKMTVQGSSAQ